MQYKKKGNWKRATLEISNTIASKYLGVLIVPFWPMLSHPHATHSLVLFSKKLMGL